MKLNSNYCKLLALAAGVSLAVPVSSRAAVVLTLQEVGSDVVLSMAAGGTVRASLISGQTSHNQSSAIGTLRNNTTGPQFLLALGSGSSFDSFYFFAVSGPSLFGTGPNPSLTATSNTGAPFGLAIFGGIFGSLILPAGYTPGAQLGAASSTFAGTSLAALGITPGTYLWTIGTNPNTETITLNAIGGAAVPESASLLVPAMAMAALGVVQVRRRSRQS